MNPKPKPAFFQAAIDRYVEEHVDYYGERLAAISVEGSVHRGEAIPGVSDLDTYVYIDGARQEGDKEWQEKLQATLRREILGFHVVEDAKLTREAFPPGHSVDPEQENEVLRWLLFRKWCFENPTDDAQENIRREAIAYDEEMYKRQGQLSFGVEARQLRYDATLVWGRDLVAGMTIPPWNRLWAQAYPAYFELPSNVARYAAGLEENYTVFKLPESPPLRLHKLGRLGVLCSAALLMGCNEFRSFKAREVLPPLKQRFPQWSEFLDETNDLATQLVVAREERLAAYTNDLVRWVDWVAGQLRDE